MDRFCFRRTNLRLCMLVSIALIASAESRGQFTLLFPEYPTDGIADLVFVDSAYGFFCNSAGTIFRTSDGGATWDRRAHYQGDPISLIRFVTPSLGFAASPSAGIWLDKISCLVTTNGGLFWNPVDVTLSDAEDFLPVSATVVVKGNDFGISRLDNFFGSWAKTYDMPIYFSYDVGVPYGTVRQIIRRPGGDLIAIVPFWRAKKEGVVGDSVSLLLRSSDSGGTWDTLWLGSRLEMQSVAFPTVSTGWMGGEHEALLKTTTGGSSWVLQHLDTTESSSIKEIVGFDSLAAVAITSGGRFLRTSDGGTTWVQTDIESNMQPGSSIAFPTRSVGFYGGTELYRTGDGGVTWQRVNNSIPGSASHIEFVTRTLGWVSAISGLYASTDGGYSWNKRNDFSTIPAIVNFDFVDSLYGWGVAEHARMKTTDGGFTWATTLFDPAVEYARGVRFFDRNLGVIFEERENGTNYSANLITSDGGATWERRIVLNREFLSSWFKIEFTDAQHLWFANQQGLWLSRDTAKTWDLCDSVSAFNSAFDMIDSRRGFCDNWPNGWHNDIAYTSDAGASWTHIAKPYPNQTLDLAVIDPYSAGVPPALFAGYDGTLVEIREGYGATPLNSYTRDVLERMSVVRADNTADIWVLGSSFQVLHSSYLITGVAADRDPVPTACRLEQNYPNPFNPGTLIRYTIPESREYAVGSRETKLVVYDILGREVAVLVNERKAPGTYEVRFDASGLATGVYTYRLSTGSFVQSKKMLLIK